MPKVKHTQGRKYPRRKLWIDRRDAAFERAGDRCEISGEMLCEPTIDYKTGGSFMTWHRACDHLIPERFVRRWFVGADPHIPENLFVITERLHAKKTMAERRLHFADFIGYEMELRLLGWSKHQVSKALKALNDSIKKKTK
jgi:hypothetical protein